MDTSYVELEAHFLNIDVDDLKKKLYNIGAKDLGEDFLRETIFYDKNLTWRNLKKFVRMRQTKQGIILTYKHKHQMGSIETEEIEFSISDPQKAKLFLEKLGLVAFRACLES